MSVPVETRELAYKIWRERGQNMSETERVMNNEHGFRISRQSLIKWCEKYDWQGRAARAEAEEKERMDATSDEALLSAILTQKKNCEDNINAAGPGQEFNQAIYAYNSVLKTLMMIRKETEKFKKTVNDVFEDVKSQGLSEEQADYWRKKILGVN